MTTSGSWPLHDLASRALIDALLDARQDYALLLDRAGTIVAANGPAAEALGVTGPSSLTGRDLFALLSDHASARLRPLFDRAVDTGRPWDFADSDGRRHFRHALRPVTGRDGRVAFVVAGSTDVTAQWQAEEALRVSLGKYKALFESFPLGITITDESGRILEANEESAKLLGVPMSEHSQLSLDSPSWRTRTPSGEVLPASKYPAIVALRERRPVHGVEMGVDRADGSTVWLDVSAAPIPLPGFGVAAAYRDVTERKLAQEALRAAEQKFTALFDHMAEGLAFHRLVRDARGVVVDYVITDINRQYEAIVGIGRDEVIGRPGSQVYGVTPPPYLAEFSSATLTGRPVQFATYFPPLGKHFSISVAPLGPDGFATIFFDVTEMKRSQEEHEKLSALVENSNEFVGLASMDGHVFYLNEAGRRLSGLMPGDSLKGLTILDFAPPDRRGLITEEVLPSIRSTGTWNGVSEVCNVRSGARHLVDIAVFVIPSRETGRPLCLATVMRDITDRERSRRQQETLEAQLQQARKMESIGRLAGGVAHDFNNLLTSIIGNVEFVLDSLAPDDPNYEPLVDVRRAGESAASLTRQLLAFSRKQMIEPKVLDPGALIGDMERMLRRTIGEDVLLETCLAPDLGCIRADAAQLEQMLVNLAVNARDAMPTGGRLFIDARNVTLDEEFCRQHPEARPGTFVRLSVRDTGRGMSEEVRVHAFEPFYTTKASGTGLGLAMVYGAVTQNSGFVRLETEEGHGTTFEIFLPVVSEAPEAAPAAARASREHAAETVLLVEDDALVRDLARRALARAGYVVLACEQGADALRAAGSHQGPIHLVVTDVIMPGMNGRQLVARLCSDRPGLRALYTSGYADDIIVHRGSLEQGLQFLPKPYTPQALVAKVQAVLDEA